jgi:hypothetical protein
MRNKKGSVLLLTTIFVVSFLAIGVASIHFIGLQNERFEADVASSRALWLADGAVQIAKRKLKLAKEPTSFSDNFGNSGQEYSATVTNDQQILLGFNHRWDVHAVGKVNQYGTIGDQERKIHAVISEFPVIGAIKATEEVGNQGDCLPQGSATIDGTCEQNVPVALSDINLTRSEIIAQAGTSIYTDENYETGLKYKNVTVIIADNKTVNFTGKDEIGTGNFLYIDCEGNPKDDCVVINKGTFKGILWVKDGTLNIQGKDAVEGAVFVEGANAKIAGTGTVKYDEGNVFTALGEFGTTGLPVLDPTVISWTEE